MATRASPSGDDEYDTSGDDFDTLDDVDDDDGIDADADVETDVASDDDDFSDESTDADDQDASLDELDETIDPSQLEELDDDEIVAAVVSAVTDFDDDELGPDDDGDGLDGLRDGEFVCRSCHLARLETQLADAKRLLCRDCV